MIKSLVKIVMLVSLFVSTAALAKPLDVKFIQQLSNFLLRKSEYNVVTSGGQILRNGDEVVRRGDLKIGEVIDGHHYGEGWSRLVKVGEGQHAQILVSRLKDKIGGQEIDRLYIYPNLINMNGVAKMSKSIKAAVASMKRELTSRVEAAVKEVSENHPIHDFRIENDNAFMQFESYYRNRIEMNTEGVVYSLDMKNLDPAVLEELLMNIQQRIDVMGEL